MEEPAHPDDITGHAKLVSVIAPVKIAAGGEHIANRVAFKNFPEAKATHFAQADATRLAAIGEFLTVSLPTRRFDLPLAPHAGDMGQIHRHMALFNHAALGHEILFLEYIPHPRSQFVFPAVDLKNLPIGSPA